MGCTSSAQNMADSQASTTDNLDHNNVKKIEDRIEKTEENKKANGQLGSLQKQVIPDREIILNDTQLVRIDNTSSDVHNSNMSSTDVVDTSSKAFNGDTINNCEASKIDENFASLKDVVEKVISENNTEDEIQINNIEETQEVDRQIEEIMESNDDMETEKEEQKNNESTSPTQSEDSRATRWEALADIAAELPPSLAVDPLTGQIYSLSK